MATVTAKYVGDLSVECTHAASGAVITTDAPVDNGGKGRCFSPTDLCATALGACAMTIMAKTAEVHNIRVEGMSMEIDKIMSASPRRIGKVVVRFHIPHDLTPKEQTLLRRAADTCPVHLSLHAETEQVFEFRFGA